MYCQLCRKIRSRSRSRIAGSVYQEAGSENPRSRSRARSVVAGCPVGRCVTAGLLLLRGSREVASSLSPNIPASIRRFERQLHFRSAPVAVGVHAIGQHAEEKGIEWKPESNPNYDTQSFADQVQAPYLALLQRLIHD